MTTVNYPELLEYKKKQGIYLFTFNIENKKRVYIGSTINLYTRIMDHYRKLKNEKHCNCFFQRVYNKYGKEVLNHEILEIVNNHSDLINREQYYINLYLENKDVEVLNAQKVATKSPAGIEYTEKRRAMATKTLIEYHKTEKAAEHRLRMQQTIKDKYSIATPELINFYTKHIIPSYYCKKEFHRQTGWGIQAINNLMSGKTGHLREYVIKEKYDAGEIYGIPKKINLKKPKKPCIQLYKYKAIHKPLDKKPPRFISTPKLYNVGTKEVIEEQKSISALMKILHISFRKAKKLLNTPDIMIDGWIVVKNGENV